MIDVFKKCIFFPIIFLFLFDGSIYGTLELKPEVILKMGYGKEEGNIGVTEDGGGPSSFAVDKDKKIYIADGANERIQIFSNEGVLMQVIPSPKGLSFKGISDLGVTDDRIYLSIYDIGLLIIDRSSGNIIQEVRINRAGRVMINDDGKGVIHSIGYACYQFDSLLKLEKMPIGGEMGISGKRIYINKEGINSLHPKVVINGKEKRLKLYNTNERKFVKAIKEDISPAFEFLGPGVANGIFIRELTNKIWFLNMEGKLSNSFYLQQSPQIIRTGFANTTRDAIARGKYIYAFASPAKGDTLLIVRYEFPEEEINKLTEE